MPAGEYDMYFERGADFTRQLTITDSDDAALDLTGYSVRMQVRKRKSSPDFLLEMTTANGRIALTDAVNGVLTISLPASDHDSAGVDDAALPAEFSGVYDLELVTSGGAVTRLIEGAFVIDPEVTR